MKKNILSLSLALVVLLSISLLAACKSGGMAVTQKGQLLKINIEGADDLPEGGTDELVVRISNRGVSNIQNIYVDVELPGEVTVVSEVHGDGMGFAEERGPSGDRTYHYTIGKLQVTETSVVRFVVRTSFGSLDRTGDMKVTAWQKELPGNKLVETHQIKLRR